MYEPIYDNLIQAEKRYNKALNEFELTSGVIHKKGDETYIDEKILQFNACELALRNQYKNAKEIMG